MYIYFIYILSLSLSLSDEGLMLETLYRLCYPCRQNTNLLYSLGTVYFFGMFYPNSCNLFRFFFSSQWDWLDLKNWREGTSTSSSHSSKGVKETEGTNILLSRKQRPFTYLYWMIFAVLKIRREAENTGHEQLPFFLRKMKFTLGLHAYTA